MLKTQDDFIIKEGDRIYEVGKYHNQQWYIRPHIVNKNNPMFSSSKYFKIHFNARKYIKNKKNEKNNINFRTNVSIC